MINLKFRYISRIESKGQKCWFVRLNRLKLPGKSFSDNTYGNKIKSLSEAIQWRNEMLGINFKKALNLNNKIYSEATKRNKTTGVLGISMQKKRYKNVYYYSYRAYSSCRPQKHKEFSWRKHGKKDAFKMAQLQRQIWEEKKMNKLKEYYSQ